MRHTVFIILASILTLGINCNAQKIDSLKYDNGFLHYRDYGSEKMEPILILTGGPGFSYHYLEEMAIKIGERHRNILFEQRGTGKSIPIPMDSTTVNLELATEDIKNLLAKLKLKKATILGHSWGAMLAMNFASKYPKMVKHLILVDTGPYKNLAEMEQVAGANWTHSFSSKEFQLVNSLYELKEKNELDSLQGKELGKLEIMPYFFSKPVPDSISSKISSAVFNERTNTLLFEDALNSYDVTYFLDNFSEKVDVICGRQDELVSFCSYELKIDKPEARLHLINECGHFPMYEKPAEFYSILWKTLENQ